MSSNTEENKLFLNNVKNQLNQYEQLLLQGNADDRELDDLLDSLTDWATNDHLPLEQLLEAREYMLKIQELYTQQMEQLQQQDADITIKHSQIKTYVKNSTYNQ